MKISNFKGLKKNCVATIQSIENRSSRYCIIKMTIPNGLTWAADEHGLFRLPQRKVGQLQKFRSFSVASVTGEGVMTIDIKTGNPISDVKKSLKLLNINKNRMIFDPFFGY